MFAVVGGCSSSVEVLLRGQSDMNSGGNHAVVRIYKLSGEGNFTNTPLADFWQDDVGALGSELVRSPRTIGMNPGESKTISLDIGDDVQFVGIAADLGNPDPDQWRAIYPVDDIGDRIHITVYSTRISVEVEGSGLPLIGAGKVSRNG